MTCRIVVHEGVIDDALRPTLEEGIRRIYGEVVGPPSADVAVEFVEVPAGRWYTAGEVSTSSIVWTTVPRGFDDEARTKLLEAIYDHWRATTGCTPNEIVITARDRATA